MKTLPRRTDLQTNAPATNQPARPRGGELAPQSMAPTRRATSVRHLVTRCSLAVMLLLPSTNALHPATEISGTILEDTTWTLSASPYVILTGLTVAPPATLHIEAGVVVKLDASNLTIEGILDLQSVPGMNVIFTSLRDDAADGEDTNGDGPTTPSAGDWGAIIIKPGSRTSSLHNLTARFGGRFQINFADGLSYRTVLAVDRAAPDLLRSTISVGSTLPSVHGVTYVNPQGSPIISNNTLSSSRSHCIAYVVTTNSVSAPEITANIFSDCEDGLYYEDVAPDGDKPTPLVMGNRFVANSTGLTLRGPASGSRVTCNQFNINGIGMWTYDAQASLVSNNSFVGNTQYGLFNYTNPVVTAEDNYWGDPSGPMPTGSGDRAGGAVDYDPWLAHEVVCPEAVDLDQDGFSPPEDCNDTDASTYPGAHELCDGRDNNCDGLVPLHENDADLDGFRSCENDCDDNDPTLNPNSVELPGNSVDEDCDGSLGDCDPNALWENHGKFVRCVAHECERLVSEGALTEAECDALVSQAARSPVGRKR